jgi:hypothetical protein
MHANAQGEIAFNKVWMTNPNNFKLHTIHIRRGNTYVHDNICYYPSGGVSLLGAYMFEQGFYNNTITNNTFYYKTIAPTAVYHNTSSLSGAVTGETAFNNPVIQLTTIPAEPLAEIMDGGTTPPVIDTGVVIIPPVVIEPTTECDCYFETVHFLPNSKMNENALNHTFSNPHAAFRTKADYSKRGQG